MSPGKTHGIQTMRPHTDYGGPDTPMEYKLCHLIHPW